MYIFFFKQKTAYEMRISDWSSDVCSSDLSGLHHRIRRRRASAPAPARAACNAGPRSRRRFRSDGSIEQRLIQEALALTRDRHQENADLAKPCMAHAIDLLRKQERGAVAEQQREWLRSEEHTSELQSLMRNSYAV